MYPGFFRATSMFVIKNNIQVGKYVIYRNSEHINTKGLFYHNSVVKGILYDIHI